MNTLTLRRPDDWHLHLRDGDALLDTVSAAARQFERAVIMPNLVPPLTEVDAVRRYRERIQRAGSLEPLLTLYLTDLTTPKTVAAAASEIVACKLYPAGATTNSRSGVTNVRALDPVLEEMARRGLPLLVHGEVTDPGVDIFDREAVFIERTLAPLTERHPKLKVVLEHVTTAEGVAFIRGAREGVGATITPHHLLLNRNDLLVGGIRPHHYCLPVLKREHHRRALVEAATSGDARFFLGTDSAPHARERKECACGAAGAFVAAAALELYAEVFDAAGALDQLEAFASRNGPRFYGLPVNAGTVTLRKETWRVPETLSLGNAVVVPFWAGRELSWRLVDA